MLLLLWLQAGIMSLFLRYNFIVHAFTSMIKSWNNVTFFGIQFQSTCFYFYDYKLEKCHFFRDTISKFFPAKFKLNWNTWISRENYLIVVAKDFLCKIYFLPQKMLPFECKFLLIKLPLILIFDPDPCMHRLYSLILPRFLSQSLLPPQPRKLPHKRVHLRRGGGGPNQIMRWDCKSIVPKQDLAFSTWETHSDASKTRLWDQVVGGLCKRSELCWP